jgi:DNA-binding GntR family transcriptional regulator
VTTRIKKRKTKPLSEEILRQLRREILDGAFRPGERIRQEDLARRYGTSRIPVREALKQLETEGLVSLTSNVGARVASLEVGELDDIYLMREQLEPLAIRLSTPNLTEEDIDALRQLVEAMDVAADIEDPSEWIKLDRQFHFRTYAGVDRPRLLKVIESLWDGTQQYRRAYVRLTGRFAAAQQDHLQILEALSARHARQAEKLSLRHIKRTRLELERHVELFAGAAARDLSDLLSTGAR